MSEHTQGEWGHRGKKNVLGAYTIFFGHGETAYNQVCQVEKKEDADLISAAPDLLAACEKVMAEAHDDDLGRLMPILEACHRAICKAKGLEAIRKYEGKTNG